MQGQIIVRRDLQKLRHGGLPAGTVFWHPPSRENASEGEAGTRIGGRRHQRLLPQPPGRWVS